MQHLALLVLHVRKQGLKDSVQRGGSLGTGLHRKRLLQRLQRQLMLFMMTTVHQRLALRTPRIKLADPNAPAAASRAMPHGSPGGPVVGAPTPATPPPVKVAKASGSDARTVAEVVGGKTALKDKNVSLRGQVVKANLGIMGKNWFHLQDGSGSAGAVGRG